MSGVRHFFGKKCQTPRGLTLVELLVVMALFVLVAGTLAATFSGGMAVWERFQATGYRDQWLQASLDQFRRDLHEVRRFKPVPFDGAYDQVSFPAAVSHPDDPERPDEIGQLGYFWDRSHGRLCRSQHPYRLLGRARLKDSCESVMTDIDRVRLSYYTWDKADGTYAWSNSWSDPEPPLAVKLEITYKDQDSRTPVTQALVVPVPVATAHTKGTS